MAFSHKKILVSFEDLSHLPDTLIFPVSPLSQLICKLHVQLHRKLISLPWFFLALKVIYPAWIEINSLPVLAWETEFSLPLKYT